MVDLPKVSNAIVTSTAPQSSVSRSDIQGNADLMASAMGKVADATDAIAVDMAKKQAADDLQNQKVTLNADGSVNVVNPANSVIFGRAGEAYKSAVQAGTIAQHANIVSEQMNDLHRQYPTDPAGFKAAADAWRAQYTSQHGGGEVGEAVAQQAAQAQTQHYNAITNSSANIDIDNQKKSINATIEDQKNTAIALARQGGTDTPEFKQAVDRMNASYDALATNPLFKTPRDQIELEKKNTYGLLQGEALVAHVDASFNKHGKAQAQEELQSLLTNTSLREVDRSRLYTQGLSRLAYLTADAKINIDANRQITTQLEEGLAKGTISPEDPTVGMAIQRARDIGDTEGAQRITAAASVKQHLRAVAPLSDGMRAETLGAGTPVDPARMQAAILGQESGNNPNIGNSIDGAQGPGQILPETFAQYAKPGERIDNPADNRAVNARILADYSQRYGGDPARIAVAYFSGPGNVAPVGNPTPYLRDARDGNGKSTSGYVSDVLRRLNGPAPFQSNLNAADAVLHLNPQERALYERHLTNLTGPGGVDNPDGSRSTLFQTTVEHDGRFYVIPTVFDGKILWDRGAQDPAAAAVERVKQIGWDKFPSYGSEDEAEARYDKMHAFMEKDTASYKQSLQQSRYAAPSANGRGGFTAEQVQQNPFLLSAYVRTLAQDPELRVQSAKQTAEAVGKAIDNGILPSPAAVAEVNQAAALYPDKVGKVAEEMNGRLTGQKIASLPQEQQDQVVDAYKRATDGADVHHMNVAAAALKQVDDSNKNLRDHPYQEAANRGWTQPPMPLDPAQPASIATGLAQRAVLGDRIGGLNHTPPPPILDKDEVPKLQAALQGQAGAQILTQIAQGLRPDQIQRLIDGDGFKDSVTAMSRSGDPAKMTAAYSFMDTLQRQNALQFDREFPDGLKDLRAWQSNLAFYPPDEAAKRLMRQYDPAQSSALKAADEVADKALKSVSADNVVSKFSTGWGPIGTGARTPVSLDAGIAAGALKADYDENYRDGFAATGDAAAADKFAMEKLNLKYAMSPANGNRVMANAPERYYPEVAGSHDWIGQQLDHEIAEATGSTPEAMQARGAERAARIAEIERGAGSYAELKAAQQALDAEKDPYNAIGQRQYAATRAIVPDRITETDIANRKPPSYQIVLQDPKTGRWGALMDATGQPRRIRFDPTQAFATHATSAEEQRHIQAQAQAFQNAGAVQP